MNRKSDYFMMALMLLMSVGLITAISVSVGIATKAGTRESEYEMLRKEYEDRITKEREEITTILDKLNQRVESESYVNTRRYEILSSELEDMCIPADNEMKDNNNK